MITTIHKYMVTAVIMTTHMMMMKRNMNVIV